MTKKSAAHRAVPNGTGAENANAAAQTADGTRPISAPRVARHHNIEPPWEIRNAADTDVDDEDIVTI